MPLGLCIDTAWLKFLSSSLPTVHVATSVRIYLATHLFLCFLVGQMMLDSVLYLLYHQSFLLPLVYFHNVKGRGMTGGGRSLICETRESSGNQIHKKDTDSDHHTRTQHRQAIIILILTSFLSRHHRNRTPAFSGSKPRTVCCAQSSPS